MIATAPLARWFCGTPKILHMAGQNQSTDVIRQATIYGFLKTPASLPDPLVVDNTNGDIWRDWSDEVRAIDEHQQ